MNRLVLFSVLASLVLAVGIASGGGVLAQASSHCDPEDREVPGNEISPCKWPNPTSVTHTTYEVYPEYPMCRERIRFHGIGAADLPPERKTSFVTYVWDDPVLQKNFWGTSRRVIVNGKPPIANLGSLSGSRSKFKYGPDHVDVLSGASWRIGELPELTRLYTTATAEVLLVVAVNPSVANVQRYFIWTNPVSAPPEMTSQLALVDACLAELELHQERLRVLQIQQEEQIRTQALVARLATLSQLAVPLKEQIELRLRGAEERARITSEWLAEQEVVEAELEELTATLSQQVEEYNAISRAFLESLNNYQSNVAARLRAAQAQEEAIQDEIDALREQTQASTEAEASQ